MGIQVYGTRFICDLCGATADSPAPASGMFNWAEQPRPAGWTALSPDLGLQLSNAYGSRLEHLCDRCSALSIGELVERMRAGEKERAASGHR